MKRKDIVTLMAGMALGAALTGGAVAAGIVAEPAWSPIYVDGRQVQMTAYNIAGNNYVKLRDIGQAVGFNVYYQNGVQVDSGAPYTGEAPVKTTVSQSTVPSAGTLQVSSYKGNTLKAGDRSMLTVSSSGGSLSASSSDPSVVSVEQVSGQWVAAAKNGGTAIITVSNSAGESGSLTLTVENTESVSVDLNANMEIRQEMIRLINETRRANGVGELVVNEALMNAAQDVSSQQVREHRPYDHIALIRYGWPHAGMYNLTVFSPNAHPEIARKAVEDWVNSPGHLATMLMEEGSCLGTGVTINGPWAYCYMVVGDPTGHNPYE